MEALRTATINPAIFFRKQVKLGSVEKGKLADLVIFNADPAQDIRDINSIDAVIMNGKLYDRAALDKELAQVMIR